MRTRGIRLYCCRARCPLSTHLPKSAALTLLRLHQNTPQSLPNAGTLSMLVYAAIFIWLSGFAGVRTTWKGSVANPEI